jgi:hypothetical protein
MRPWTAEEERAKFEVDQKEKRALRMAGAEEAKAKKKKALTAPHAVVLDLEFGRPFPECFFPLAC